MGCDWVYWNDTFSRFKLHLTSPLLNTQDSVMYFIRECFMNRAIIAGDSWHGRYEPPDFPTQFPPIRDQHGTPFFRNEDIAKCFERYYTTLYDLKSASQNPVQAERRSEAIRDLAQYCPKPLSQAQAKEMEQPPLYRRAPNGKEPRPRWVYTLIF